MATNEQLYPNRGTKITIIISLFPTIALVAVILRLYTRISIIHNPAVDDWVSVIALLFSVATSTLMALQVRHGLGRHFSSLTDDEGVAFLKTLYISIIIYNIGLLVTKLSVLLQYLRVATNKKVRLACYMVIVFTTTYGLEAFFTGVFHCWPIGRFWGETNAGRCINKPVLWFVNAALNITSDILLLILPIFILSVSTLPRKKKVAICLILSLGGLYIDLLLSYIFQTDNSFSTAIVSVLRLYSLYIVSISEDLSWDISDMVIWSCIELNVGIICTCVSTLKPLTSRFIPYFHHSRPSGSKARHTSMRVARGSEAEIIPTENEDHKTDLEVPPERGAGAENFYPHTICPNNAISTKNNLDFIRTAEPSEIQCGPVGFYPEVTENNEKLFFTNLPAHPALLYVNTNL